MNYEGINTLKALDLFTNYRPFVCIYPVLKVWSSSPHQAAHVHIFILCFLFHYKSRQLQ